MKIPKIIFSLGIVILLLNITSNLYAQETFSYQAVVRDSGGQVLANQLVSLQIGILSIADNLPPVYQEHQEVWSNDYGVLQVAVGAGSAVIGDFGSIDWSVKSFLKVAMDINGGNNFELISISEIRSVPKALYAERAKAFFGKRFGLYVTDFGAEGAGLTDDTEAFEQALDSAAITGSKVFVPQGIYRISRTLEIKDGVSLIGEGSGSDPLETPYNGTLLWYTGEDFAIKVSGHSSRLKDFVLRDKSEGNALGGIELIADGRLLESVYFFEVLISGFVNGVGLKLRARNAGGIAYSSFNNVRIRHGKIGIKISHDETSFANSNTWNHCQISGGGFKYGMLINGGNNNILNGVVIEPFSSTHGHFFVKKGQVSGVEMRIEGAQQAEHIPLIKFAAGTFNSEISGVYAGGLTLDMGNNFINMKSGKAIHYRNSSSNRFRNATFFSADQQTILDWDITGNGVAVEILDPELSERHKVLKITVPAGITSNLEPTPAAQPMVKALPLYDQVNFGFYVKTDSIAAAYAYTNSTNGWTRSTCHSGQNEWEFVGMNARVNRSVPARFVLQIKNSNSSEAVVYVSMPTLSFGNQLPTLEEQPLYASGGQLTGLLTHALASASTPADGFLVLPLSANYFEITNVQNISRINHLTANRFPVGSRITLLFNEAGIGVSNGAYLQLKAGYNSVANGSLSLLSNGDGTWREIDRNN